MPKYLLLKHYRGGPEPHHPCPEGLDMTESSTISSSSLVRPEPVTTT
jgi:hypothetical protein